MYVAFIQKTVDTLTHSPPIRRGTMNAVDILFERLRSLSRDEMARELRQLKPEELDELAFIKKYRLDSRMSEEISKIYSEKGGKLTPTL